MQIFIDIRYVINRKSYILLLNELNFVGLKKEIGVIFELFSYEYFQMVRFIYLKWWKKYNVMGVKLN